MRGVTDRMRLKHAYPLWQWEGELEDETLVAKEKK